MTELDYINVSNKVSISAAINSLNDVLVIGDYPLQKDELFSIIDSLKKMREDLALVIKVED